MNKLLTLIFGTLFLILAAASSSSAQNVNESFDPYWSNDVTFSPDPATYGPFVYNSDGNLETLISPNAIDIGSANQSSFLDIKKSGGGEFQFVDFNMDLDQSIWPGGLTVSVTGYKAGIAVTSTVPEQIEANGQTFDFSSTAGFNDVDEIKITGTLTAVFLEGWTYNLSLPTSISSLTANSATTTNAAAVSYTATFAASVSGLSTGNFSLNTSGGISGASVSSVSGSGTTWTVNVNTGSGDGTVQLQLANTSGLSTSITNSLPFNGDTYTIDKTAPILTSLIYSSNNARFNYAKTGDIVTLVFGANEAIQTPSLTIGGHSITCTNTGGNNYSGSYTLTPGDTEGRINFNLTVTDLVGNSGNYTDLAAGDDIEFDMTPPTAAISAPSVTTIDNNGPGTVTYTVTYADANFGAGNLSNAGITLNTTNTANGTFNVIGKGFSFTVTISNITGTGTLGITLAAGFSSDLAGNTDAGAGPSALFNVVSGNAGLASMGPQYGPLSPVFSTGTTSYTLNVSNTAKTMWVKPVSSDAGATITVNGSGTASGALSTPVKLTEGGSTAINVAVLAQDGIATQTYTINVTRATSGNADLSFMGPSNTRLSPFFSPSITSYTRTVPNSVSTFSINPIVADPNATFTVNGNPVASGTMSQAVTLTAGVATPVIVIVTAQNGATKTYTIMVTRSLPNNANLASIGTSTPPLTPVFVPNITSYTVSVTNATKTMTLTPVAADPLAAITVNTATVASGATSDPIALAAAATTTVTVVVTAQDGTAKTYTIAVTRAGSANNFLASMGQSISPLTPVFSPVKNSYTLSVSIATQTMTVTPVTEDANATITVNNAPLTSGSTSDPVTLTAGATTPISVVVTAQNGATNTYTILVTRALGADNSFGPGISVTKQTETVTLARDGITVHQGISPNGDGVNDFLQIDNISQYPDNNLKIMNRDGQLVYEAKGYDNSSKLFDGHSNKNGQMQLPGTYFYQLDYTVSGTAKHKTGFIVLKY